jgi:DEAD/DEAH box helicase domain-containing protein
MRFDLMRSIEEKLGRRIGLDAIAKATLGVGKTAAGLEALKWWKEGRIHDIAEYCCFDVKVTKLVHEFGAQNGRVYYFDDRTQRRESIPVEWKL